MSRLNLHCIRTSKGVLFIEVSSFQGVLLECLEKAIVVTTGWINQLSTMMEVAVAVADLIHIQDSSVLVCLENGWDSTAQV